MTEAEKLEIAREAAAQVYETSKYPHTAVGIRCGRDDQSLVVQAALRALTLADQRRGGGDEPDHLRGRDEMVKRALVARAMVLAHDALTGNDDLRQEAINSIEAAAGSPGPWPIAPMIGAAPASRQGEGQDPAPQPIAVPCHRCSGTGWATWEDRHTKTNRDRCTACGGSGWEPAATGERREASFDPATGRCFGEGEGHGPT